MKVIRHGSSAASSIAGAGGLSNALFSNYARDKGWGMGKLFPDQQQYFMKSKPKVFVPANGAWGRQGATLVYLKSAAKAELRKAMLAAWLRTAPKKLAAKYPEGK